MRPTLRGKERNAPRCQRYELRDIAQFDGVCAQLHVCLLLWHTIASVGLGISTVAPKGLHARQPGRHASEYSRMRRDLLHYGFLESGVLSQSFLLCCAAHTTARSARAARGRTESTEGLLAASMRWNLKEQRQALKARLSTCRNCARSVFISSACVARISASSSFPAGSIAIKLAWDCRRAEGRRLPMPYAYFD